MFLFALALSLAFLLLAASTFSFFSNRRLFKLFSFSEKLSDHYQVSDLAITRSGASSIAELINLKIPFIAIPLPSSADCHQFKNALNFQKKGYFSSPESIFVILFVIFLE